MSTEKEIPSDVATVNLTQIKEALSPFSIDGDGLESMGITPIGFRQNGRNAKYYAAESITKAKSWAISKWIEDAR